MLEGKEGLSGLGVPGPYGAVLPGGGERDAGGAEGEACAAEGMGFPVADGFAGEGIQEQAATVDGEGGEA